MMLKSKPNTSSRMLGDAVISGGVLIPTLCTLAVLVSFALVAFSLTGNVSHFADRNVTKQKAMAVADACLELQFAQWCAILQYGVTFAPPSSAFDNIALPDGALFPWVPNFGTSSRGSGAGVVSNYKIQALNSLEQPVPHGEKPTKIPTSDIGTNLYQYLATVDVTLPSRGGPVTVRMGRIFQLQNRSPWSYAIFYDKDLEIHPGPPMSITGDVHTNSDLYVGAGGGKISFMGQVTTSGSVTVGKSSHDDSARNSKTEPDYLGGPPRSGVAVQSPLGMSDLSLSGSDGNVNNDSYREVIEVPEMPISSNPDPFTPVGKNTLRFYNMADYKVSVGTKTDDLAQTVLVTVLDGSNQTVSTSSNIYKVLVTGGTISGKVYAPILTSTATLQDNREGATMKLTTVNIGALKKAVDDGIIPAKPEGLLFYINDPREVKPFVADVPAIPGTPEIPAVYNKKGKLISPAVPAVPGVPAVHGNPKMEPALFIDNGNFLPTNGLTIVSSNPLYVQGDYNTGETTPTNLESNKTNPLNQDTTKSGYWEPAALIGDAITILSNSWTTSSTASTDARATTVNAAVMAGNIPSDGTYSGGVENFPRFLEDWTGVRFTYRGSMVCLFDSQQATGVWGQSNVYAAPTRVWYYDRKFWEKTPPGTFMVPGYQKLRWFPR